MKKILYLISICACMLLASCQKDTPEMTATEPLAGQWYVQCDYVDGTDVIEDCYGLGRFLILTYNTAANKADEMIIDDLGNFWEFKVKVSCDQVSKTFSANQTISLVDGYDIACNVTNGQMVENGATTPSGQKADFITFDIEFEDDPGSIYRLNGFRYTGFELDD